MDKKLPAAGGRVSRREFIAAGLAAPAFGALVPPFLSRLAESIDPQTGAPPYSVPLVDLRRLVSRADLTYTTPAARSEAGIPVGNGRMGSLVWTSPTSLNLQVNRPDVFAEGSSTNSFPERHIDYGSGCAAVEIHLGGFGDDVFAPPAFRQHLGVYEGLMTVAGNGVAGCVLAWHERDVMAIELDDQRAATGPVSVDLRMLRYIEQYIPRENYELEKSHTILDLRRDHTAASTLGIRDGRILLTQQFREGEFYCASAVAIVVAGRKSKARCANSSTVRLSVAPERGPFTVLIASAASFDPRRDVAALALAALEAASTKSFDELLESNRAWWHDFWAQSFVQLHSDDGEADFVELHHTYYLYLMAATSRGSYPPRFGGMLWFTRGDMREWGSEQWWANLSCYYNGLPPLNRFELMDPMFALYSQMHDSCARAARQQWGSRGIFIPETTWFDGLNHLPEGLAAEMQALYLLRKPWDQRSTVFQEAARTKQPLNSRWNWIDSGKWIRGRWTFRDKGAGPFGHTTHILSSGAKIAFLYWLRYDYTRDEVWLRDRAYPMLRGIAELYRNFPGVRKEADGKYHIHNVNNQEPVWGAQDTNEELSAMHGILPVAIRASEILGVDADLRSQWIDFHRNLTPIATNDSRGARTPRGPGQPRIWIAGLPPVKKGRLEAPGLVPVLEYDLCTVETADREMFRLGGDTYDASRHGPFTNETPVNVLNSVGTSAAHLGRAEDLRHILPNQLRCLAPQRDFCDWVGGGKTGVLPNRLTLREGPGAIGCERIGRVSQALHAALLQSAPASPGGDPVLHVFTAWPRGWNAQSTLLARGAFLVTSSMQNGQVEFLAVHSQAGSECRLRNPWAESQVTLYRNGKRAEEIRGSLLTFSTDGGETIVVVRGRTERS